MSLQFSVNPRKNPQDLKLEPKFYATARSTEVVDVRDLCKNCRAHSTFTMGDSMGVIEAVLEHAIEQLQMGNIVRLGGLGSLRLTINKQEPAETAKLFTESNIKGCHVLFTAGADLLDMCRNMTYKRVGEPEKKEETNPVE